MIEQIYLQADELAKGMKQKAGEKNDLYITLEQLMMILENFQPTLETLEEKAWKYDDLSN